MLIVYIEVYFFKCVPWGICKEIYVEFYIYFLISLYF